MSAWEGGSAGKGNVMYYSRFALCFYIYFCEWLLTFLKFIFLSSEYNGEFVDKNKNVNIQKVFPSRSLSLEGASSRSYGITPSCRKPHRVPLGHDPLEDSPRSSSPAATTLGDLLVDSQVPQPTSHVPWQENFLLFLPKRNFSSGFRIAKGVIKSLNLPA